MRISLLTFAILFCSSFHHHHRKNHQRVTGVIADSAMVVTAHPDATKIGIDILKKGGNAIDAAIAVKFALAVCYPSAGNLGGGGFMVIRKNDGEVNTLDFREMSPGGSTKNMFVDSSNQVSRQLIQKSHLAAGVPGSVDGMWTAHHKYGHMTWQKLVEPAIELALKGFQITQQQADNLNGLRRELIALNAGKNYFLKEGSDTIWKKMDTLYQLDLAKTLQIVCDKGRKGFYEDTIAFLIEQEMKNNNGIITVTDLKNYRSVWRKPVSVDYEDYTIISMPPPSSGGVALIQLLNMVENYPGERWGHNSKKTIHLMTEAEKRVYADRSTWLGDPDFFTVPVNELTDKKYAKERMKDFSTRKIKPSLQIKAEAFAGYESSETTHFSIIDKWGNAVAVTTTLNDAYGSRISVSGAGFLLNNEMDDFSAQPGTPNLYGLIGGKANAIEPNKRMLSSMTPTIVLKDNKLFMVTGTPGGSTIITTVFQNILNIVEHNMTLQEGVNAQRFHHQWMPDEIYIEQNFDDKVVAELSEMGYTIKVMQTIGRVDAILIRDDKKLEGAGDPRGDDLAIGY